MKSKKIKNALLVTISLALVAAASVAITWAVMVGSDLDREENTFENGELEEKLDEPWFTFTDHNSNMYSSTNLPTGYPETVITSKKKGEDIAAAYNANTLIPKNPTLWNTKANTNAFVALGVRYTVQFGADTYSDANGTTAVATANLKFEDSAPGSANSNAGKTVFDNIAELYKSNTTAGICDGWTQDTTATGKATNGVAYGNLYYYNKALVNSGSEVNTDTPLFQYVKIKNLTANDKGLYAINVGNSTTYYTKTLPTFKISLKGYAVDANSFASSTVTADTTQTTGDSGSQAALEALYTADSITVS